jgi:uncharacterized membrane protein
MLLASFIVAIFIACPMAPFAQSSPDQSGFNGRLLVLEFNGPIPPDIPARLAAAGAVAIGFLPPGSLLVSAAPGRAPLAGAFDLASIGPLLPEQKLDPCLAQGAAPGDGRLTVLFTGPRSTLESELERLGMRPTAWGPESVRLEPGAGSLDRLLELRQVFWVEPLAVPQPVMDRSARTLGARQASDGAFQNDGVSLWSYNNGAFEGTTGAGVNISIVDSGIDGTHPAFDGRKASFRSYGSTPAWSDQDSGAGHGTMCAGIAAGNGRWRSSDPSGTPGKYTGMAPGAGLVGQANIYQYYWTYSIYDLCRHANERGALVSSNSWGDSGSAGRYTSTCREYDTYVRDSNANLEGDQPLVVVASAGNSGPTSFTVGAPSTAKNVIAVGALGNDKTGPYGPVSSTEIIGYSSRGPCEDGRIKPDVCAPGVDVYTTSAQNNIYKGALGTVPDDTDSSSYFVGGGTSAACPNVAGACALVISHWRDKNGATPSPALTKALLVNGARPLPGYVYPGPDQGWGRVDAARSVISKPDRRIYTVDQTASLSTGDTESLLFNVSSSAELKVSLVWTDRPGSPSAAYALVNDLDLVVTDPDGNVYRGNNFVNGQSVPGGASDRRNNVEGFLLRSPRPGRYYMNVTGDSVPVAGQDYALVISGVFEQITADPAAGAGSITPAAPLEGELVHVEFSASNAGKGPARNFPYVITVDGQRIASGVLPDLGPQQATAVSADWVAVRGAHSFAFEIDPERGLDEMREDNNRASVSGTVLHFGVSAAMEPPAATVDPGSVSAFQLTATNAGTAPDTLLLSAAVDLPGWEAALSHSSFSLAPGASERAQLSVACPALAPAHETAVVTCRVVSQGNASYADAKGVTLAVRQIFSVSLPPPPPVVEVFPWEKAEFDLTVQNGGNGDDIVGLDARAQDESGAPIEGWEATLSRDNLLLGARSSGQFRATVTPPASAPAGNTSFSNVSAYSQGGLSASTTLTVVVKQYYDIDLSFVLKQSEGLPGTAVEAIYFIHNLGNGPDEVRLALSAEPGWTAGLPASLLLAGRELRPGNLTLFLPADALAGDYPFSFSVLSAGGELLAENFTVRVLQVFAVAAAPSPRREVVYPGEPVDLALSLSNLGNGNDTFTILPEGLPGTLSVASIGGPVPLNARSSAAAGVRLQTSLQTAPGESLLTFRAQSRGSPATINYTTLVLVVLPIPAAPRSGRDAVPFAPDPTAGGAELCGVAVLLAAVCTAVPVVRGWRRRLDAFEYAQFHRTR